MRVAGQEGAGARAHSPGLCLKDTNRVHFLSEKSTSLPTFYFSAFSCFINFVSFFIRTKLGKAQAIKCHEPSRHGSLSMGLGVNAVPLLPRPEQTQILSALPPSGDHGFPFGLGPALFTKLGLRVPLSRVGMPGADVLWCHCRRGKQGLDLGFQNRYWPCDVLQNESQ